jgi:hypothetical protein
VAHRPETADRLAAALAGTLTIPLLGAAGALAGGSCVGVAAAWLLAAAPFHVYYSREGRPYALLTLLATLLLIAFLTPRRRLARRLGWGSALAAPYIALSAFAVLAGALAAAVVCGAVEAVSRWRGRRAGRLSAASATGAPCAAGEAGKTSTAAGGGEAPGPWLELGLAALAGFALLAALYGHYPRPPQLGSFPPAHGALVLAILNALAATPFWPAPLSEVTPWYGAAALAGLLALAVRRPRVAAVLAGLALGTAGAAWAGMAISGHFFTLRYFTPVLPAYLVLAAAGIDGVARAISWAARAQARRRGGVVSPPVAPLLAGAAVAVLVAWNLGPALACPYRRADWHAAARAISIDARRHGTVLAANRWSAYCTAFYLRSRSAEAVQGAAAAGRSRPARRDRLEVAEIRTAPGPAVAAALTRGGCWLVHGGYPQRPALKRWMRNFTLLWRGRDEGIEVFRCQADELAGLDPGEAPEEDYPMHPAGSFLGSGRSEADARKAPRADAGDKMPRPQGGSRPREPTP